MLKKIKRVKEMRLDELIKYVWDNGIKHKTYEDVNNMELEIRFSPYGYLDSTPQNVTPSDLFKVEVEEDITEDTEFECVVINTEHYIYSFRYISIKESRDKLPKAVEIFARIDGRMQKVWERE